MGLNREKGYIRISREWQKGDRITIDLPMPIRRVASRPQVKENAGRVALERGPIVYCFEGVDNGGKVSNLALVGNAIPATEHRPDLLGGVTVLKGVAQAKQRTEDGESVVVKTVSYTAVPYYAWNHRGVGEMAVWVPRSLDLIADPPRPTVASAGRASASHIWRTDTVEALNDQVEPKNSNDHSIPRLTWWDHRGTTEWVQYDFQKPKTVSSVEVYWFDDTGRGSCRLPKAWRVLYKSGNEWKPVTGASEYGTKANQFNRTRFDSVETNGLRLEVQLRPNVSGGILEWRVNP